MRLLSYKHCGVCPLCGLHSDGCNGHPAEQYDRLTHRERQEKIRGTPEWRDVNRAKRRALKPKRNLL